jgi:hypothetical protein
VAPVTVEPDKNASLENTSVLSDGVWTVAANATDDWQASTYVILRLANSPSLLAFDRSLDGNPPRETPPCHLRRRHNIKSRCRQWIGFNWISKKHSPALVFATTLKMHKSVLLHFATTLLASSSAAFTFLTPSSSRATTARHADAYSYTYGGAPPPPQGGNAGPRTDESRVVGYTRWRSCYFLVAIPTLMI